MNYRKDYRSDEEFRRDIKVSTMAEKKIIGRWINLIENTTGNRPEVRDNGCDNTGEYLDDNEVSCDADYYVDGHGLVEVKFSNPLLQNVFHLKVGQVQKILSDKINILFANGWGVKGQTTFSFITSDQLGTALLKAREVNWRGFGGKAAYRFKINQFHWESLP